MELTELPPPQFLKGETISIGQKSVRISGKNWRRYLLPLVFWMIFNTPATAIELTDSPECPQPREKTPKAPDEFYKKINPLKKTEKNIKKGKLLYMVKAKTLQCKHCHGMKGDGLGGMAPDSFPNPQNFTCAVTMNQIPDGQLFWAITHGIPHTSMPSYESLSEKQIWQLVLYIREFSKNQEGSRRAGFGPARNPR